MDLRKVHASIMTEDGFQFVKKKKRSLKSSKPSLQPLPSSLKTPGFKYTRRKSRFKKPFDPVQQFSHRVMKGMDEIRRSTFYRTLCAMDIFETLSSVYHIVCLGLGPLHQDYSQYQLSLLLLLKEMCKSLVDIVVFDPLFDEKDKAILEGFQLHVEDKNMDGKYVLEATTLFYMPHCEKFLYNNVIEANLNANTLSHVILFGNSFDHIISNSDLQDEAEIKWLKHLKHEVKEFPLTLMKNESNAYFAFQNTSFHIF